MDSFKHIHRHRDDRLKCYREDRRAGYQTMPHWLWQRLLRRNADELFPCNAEARIRVAELACETFDRCAIARRAPHHFITFAPACFVYPIEEAHRFNPRRIAAMVRQAMGAIPLFGFVELALYIGWGPSRAALGRWFVSMHVHFITWGVEKPVLVRVLRPLHEQRRNMVGRGSVWIRTLEPDEVERALLYMAKGQLKEYRINSMWGEEVDPSTGVITQRTRQQKRWMETGNHVRMCRVFGNRWISELIFGNGAQGGWIADKVRYEARRPFARWADGENARWARRGRPEPYPVVGNNKRLGWKLERELPGLF